MSENELHAESIAIVVAEELDAKVDVRCETGDAALAHEGGFRDALVSNVFFGGAVASVDLDLAFVSADARTLGDEIDEGFEYQDAKSEVGSKGFGFDVGSVARADGGALQMLLEVVERRLDSHQRLKRGLIRGCDNPSRVLRRSSLLSFISCDLGVCASLLEIFQDGKELARERTLIRIFIHGTLQYSHVFFVFDSCSFNSLLVLALLALSRGDFSFQVTPKPLRARPAKS